jgi:hypothetical protein
MKLMYDIDAQPEFIVEETLDEATGKSSKKYKINGIFSTIGEKNRNGRIYPRNLWEGEVQKYQENFNSGSINTLMEWEHPARTNVDPMEAVAKITSLNVKDKFVMGEAVLLDNPKANQLKSLIDNGVKISVSSRGVGSVKNGIVENFKLVTYDIVSAPSDYNATMNGLVESFKLNEGIIEDLSFGIDDNGSIVTMTESECNGECSMFEKEDIHKAFKERFNEVLSNFSGPEMNEAKSDKDYYELISKEYDLLKSKPVKTLKSEVDRNYKVHSAKSKSQFIGMLLDLKFSSKAWDAHDRHESSLKNK